VTGKKTLELGVCRMFSDFTSVVQGLVSEVISSYRCHMIMGMIVEGYRMCTFGARVCPGMDTFPDHVLSYVGNRMSRCKVTRREEFLGIFDDAKPTNDHQILLGYIIHGGKFGMWIHTDGSHSKLLLSRILVSFAFLIGIHCVQISLNFKYPLLHNNDDHSS
jgi:hypothetical protein